MFDKTILQNAPQQLETARLILKQPEPAFAASFAEMVAHSKQDYAYIPAWMSKADDVALARSKITQSREFITQGESLVWFAFEKASGRMVARLDAHHWDFDIPKCEIGYMGDSRLVGKGYVREATLAMMDWLYTQGVVRIEAQCDSRNARSISFAIQALGMQQEGVLRSADRDNDGALCDQVILARLRRRAESGGVHHNAY
jgi:RimJ/RimL family protein N-acetyltransferase